MSTRRRSGRPPLCSEELDIRVLKLRAEGRTFQYICDELNRNGIPTPGGGKTWYRSHISRLLGTRHSVEMQDTAIASQSENVPPLPLQTGPPNGLVGKDQRVSAQSTPDRQPSTHPARRANAGPTCLVSRQTHQRHLTTIGRSTRLSDATAPAGFTNLTDPQLMTALDDRVPSHVAGCVGTGDSISAEELDESRKLKHAGRTPKKRAG